MRPFDARSTSVAPRRKTRATTDYRLTEKLHSSSNDVSLNRPLVPRYSNNRRSWRRLFWTLTLTFHLRNVFLFASSFSTRSDWKFRRRSSVSGPHRVSPSPSSSSSSSSAATPSLLVTESCISVELPEKPDPSDLFHAMTSPSSPLSGLSRFHLSMVPRLLRQKFLTGQESPVIVSFRDNPTLRWLNRASAQVLINGTTIEKSFASLDRFQWLDSEETREAYTVELLAEIKSIHRPAYLQIMPDRRLWATGFAVGYTTAHVTAVDCTTGNTDLVCATQLKWPNELQALDADTVLVSDGFLVPMKDKGGLYILYKGQTVCITDPHDRWFYHRAVWIEHPNGSASILSARCRLQAAKESKGISKTGQLVWLCAPPSFDRRMFGAEHVRPWDLRVLAEGPDVMFAVADMDPNDDTIEVIASEFFSKRITLHSLRIIMEGHNKQPVVTFRRVIDDTVGQAYGCILANLDGSIPQRSVVIDSGSTIPELQRGDTFSELLVTSHECNMPSVVTSNDKNVQLSRDGGSLYSYKVPIDWRNDPWERTVVASGFKVNGKLSNMINPGRLFWCCRAFLIGELYAGAPGFVYTFQPRRGHHEDRPWIAVAGDCAESAYIFRPVVNGGYRLLLEVQCEATVGSIAVGYDDFGSVDQDSGYAKLYIPCYEHDKILVLGFGGKGEEDDSGW